MIDPVRHMLSYGVYESDDAFFADLWTREGAAAWAACTDVAAMLALLALLDPAGAVRAACACVAEAVPEGEPLALDERANELAAEADARIDAAADDEEVDTRALDVTAAVLRATAAARRIEAVLIHEAEAPVAVDEVVSEQRLELDRAFERLGELVGEGAPDAVRARSSCPTLDALTAVVRPVGEPAAFLAGHLIWGRALPDGWLDAHPPAAIWAGATDAAWLLLLLHFVGDEAGLTRATDACRRDSGVTLGPTTGGTPGDHLHAIERFVEDVARTLHERVAEEPPEEREGWEEAVATEAGERRVRRALADDVRGASACPSRTAIEAAVDARQRLIAADRAPG